MRKIVLLSLALCFFATAALAEDVSRGHSFTAAGIDDAVLTIRNTGIYYHRLTWTGAGTRTSCLAKVEQSVDGTTWTDLIAAQDCTTDGTATTTGYANFVRMQVTALTGSGNTAHLRYDGNPIQPSLGSVTVDTTGLATSANQTGGSQKTQIVTSAGAAVDTFGGATPYASGDPKGTSSGILGMVSDGTLIRASAGTSGGLAKVDISGTAANTTAILTTGSGGTFPITASSLPLPTGAATEAGNLATIAGKDFATQTTLAAIKAKTDNIPALGQALAAGSVPVILPSATITTLTPPAAITGFSTEASLAKLTITQGASLGSNTMNMPGGSVTTASPTYTNGQISPFTMNTKGSMRVGVFDSTGTQIDVFGGGTEYASGAAKGTETGKVSMWSDGTNIWAASAAKPFPVEIKAGAGTGGFAAADNAAFSFGSTSYNPGGGVYNSSRSALTSGSGGSFALNPKRGLYVTLEAADSSLIGVAAQPLQVSLANTAANATSVNVDLAKIGGSATDTGGGNIGSATQRIVLATDQATPTNPFNIKGTGTAGSANSGVVTVQGIAAMTPVQVSQATAANLNANVTSNGANLATAAKQPALGTAGSASSDVITVQGISGGTALPVSSTTLATAAKQPALGTAGSASSDVITIQGVTGMTPLKMAPATADAEPGAARTNPPVPVAGSDYAGSPTVQIPKVDSSGNLYGIVAGAGTAGSPGTAVLTVQGITNGTPQPVSGTVVANGGGTAGSANAGVMSVQGIANMTPINIAGTGTAGAPGTAVLTVQGIGSGTPVVSNTAQIAGTTTLVGNGATGNGSQRVTIASDNTPFPVKTDQTTHGTTDKVAADLYFGGSAASETNPIYARITSSLATYVSAVANGTTDVALVAADANNFVEVGWISCTNTSATTGTAIKLCDGACSTSNWVMLPCPDARLSTASAGAVNAFPPNFAFRTSAKNHAVNFVTTGSLTTDVTVSAIYRKVGN
jgi:hypothetical protein